MAALIAILLLIVLVYGAASGMQSYASAKQAQATIEVAQVAQVNAWGNLVVILLLALVIVCVLALVVWLVVRMFQVQGSRYQVRNPRKAETQPQLDDSVMPNLDRIIQIKMLDMLYQMSPPVNRPQLQKPSEQNEPMDMEWLRRQ